jgi:hypothetical protein
MRAIMSLLEIEHSETALALGVAVSTVHRWTSLEVVPPAVNYLLHRALLHSDLSASEKGSAEERRKRSFLQELKSGALMWELVTKYDEMPA